MTVNSRFKEFKKIGVASDNASIMGDSNFFKDRSNVSTPLPILNIAFSGEVDKGFGAGLTMFTGDSGCYKSLLTLYCLKSYLDTYEDACAFFYDSEFGIDSTYLESFGIDPDRVMHIPIKHIEELKQDIYAKLDAIKRGEHFFFFIDSIGNLMSKKTVDDIEDEKNTNDMSRAKALKPLFALMTNGANMKDVPIIVINHSYETQELFSKTVIGGGKSATYNPNIIFNMTRRKDVGTDKTVTGFEFSISVLKSRIIKAFSKLSFDVSYDYGIEPNSGLLDLAVEGGFIKSAGGWYQLVDDDKNPIGNKLRESALTDTGFYDDLLKNSEFKDFVKKTYKLNAN
jgi:RecA/RadA recombinase